MAQLVDVGTRGVRQREPLARIRRWRDRRLTDPRRPRPPIEFSLAQDPIRFTSAELLRLLNTNRNSGNNYKDIVDWLDVMTSTTIISNGVVYEAVEKRFGRDHFHVFDRAVR